MSRAKAILLVALLAATFGFAQDNPGNGTPGQDNSPKDQSSTEQSLNIQGCLSSSAMGDSSFAITQDQTGKVYRLSGNVSELASHAGQEVMLSGVMVSGEHNSENGLPADSGTESPGLQVSGIQMISDHCLSHPSTKEKGNGAAGAPQNVQNKGNATRKELAAQSDTTEPVRKIRNEKNLPQTATILPLLGLVGLSSLVTGFIFRNR
jgi:hypothetical protein